MRVLVACEESQAVCKAFRAKGHEAYSCDLVECSGGYPEWHIRENVLDVINSEIWDLMIAHPPCTRLTNAGVRWLKEPPKGKTLVQMWRDLFEDAAFYKTLRDCDIPLKAIENPRMHKHARELVNPGYAQVIQPWYFGEEAFKETRLELIGLPDLIPTNKLNPPEKGTKEYKEWSFIHRMSPGPNRAKKRSKTFKGIAEAMADQWGSL